VILSAQRVLDDSGIDRYGAKRSAVVENDGPVPVKEALEALAQVRIVRIRCDAQVGLPCLIVTD